MEVNAATAATAAAGVKAGRPAEPGPTTVKRSASIAALAKAMAAAQSEMKNPLRESVNPHFGSKYADLATVRDAVVPVLAKHKLAVMQFPCELDEAPALMTLLAHESGEWIETTTKLRPTKSDPQGIGSSQTYARRYALQAIAGVAGDEDDDGNAASKPAPAKAKQPAGDNLPMRAKASVSLASCQTRDDYLAVCQQIAADVKAGVMSMADRDALAPIARETADRFPPKQPA